MSASAGKRRRDAAQPLPAADIQLSDSDNEQGPATKKPRADGGGDAGAGDEEPEAPVAPDADIAVVADIAQQALANAQPQNSAAEKRAKFLEKFPGMTPEQILGMLPSICCCTASLNRV